MRAALLEHPSSIVLQFLDKKEENLYRLLDVRYVDQKLQHKHSTQRQQTNVMDPLDMMQDPSNKGELTPEIASDDFISTGSTSDNLSDGEEIFDLADLRDTVINKVRSQGGAMGNSPEFGKL